MHTLVALLVVAAAAFAIARPSGPTEVSMPLPGAQDPASAPPLQDYISDDYLLQMLYIANQRKHPDSPLNAWINRAIYRIDQMDDEDDRPSPYGMDIAPWIRFPLQDMLRTYDDPRNVALRLKYAPKQEVPRREPVSQQYEKDGEWRKIIFAYTPLDKGYYESDENSVEDRGNHEPEGNTVEDRGSYEREENSVEDRGGFQAMNQKVDAVLELTAPEPPRQIRQNPNLSKQKHLLGPDLTKLKTGLANKDYRLPVSLLPTNLRWLKINRVEESSDSSDEATDQPNHVHMVETASDPSESIYGVAIFAAIGAALTMVVFGFGFGWYTLSQKAKAAADVEYPAYGVTGPTIDSSGDRRLAQSAHMYHYQHQKQQIIAMERNGMEQRAASISDPESEEENEEGDYTVYECPGFATTGNMEVKNPMFSEETTPATPVHCELVKPQPKD